jgi:hypothetical protein
MPFWSRKMKPLPAATPIQAAVIHNADKIEALIHRLDHLAPCANPECIEFRNDMREIVGNTREVHG